MYKVTISTGYKGKFDTLEQANQWISDGISGNWWGLPDRWTREEGSEITREVESIDGETYTEYFYPAEYTIEGPTDITTEVEAIRIREEKIAKGKKAYKACMDCLDFVRGVNLDLVENSDQMMLDLADILKALTNGQAPTAKALILSTDNELYNYLKDDLLYFLRDY